MQTPTRPGSPSPNPSADPTSPGASTAAPPKGTQPLGAPPAGVQPIGTQPVTGAAGGSRGAGAAPGGTGSRSGPTDDLRGGAERVASSVKEAASGVADTASATASALRDEAAAMAEPLQEKARSMAEDQKRAGAARIGGVARAISSAADELDDQMPQTAGLIRDAAAQLDHVAEAVRHKSLEDLAHDTDRFARNNTAAFFGLSLVAGFALARFLKSGTPAGATGATATGGPPTRRTASPPLQPHPGQGVGKGAGPGASTAPRPASHARQDAFPNNEF
ncbi:hypothetical protein GJ689_20875 [Rhodoplanes serenus]|uniref:Nutrient deprivation-induced protein n=1 Tax=Rhodoplanes serenus TaxID=200615 RepID=A0A9X4XNY1_9BRAD|nr:hypothetical protein [Rhodoplanes serenus]MTW18658.1 hypothetical protein [Rhodoplanes serenus]